jgi:hypothetical protein
LTLKKQQLKPALTTERPALNTKYRIINENILLYFVFTIAVSIQPTEAPGWYYSSVNIESASYMSLRLRGVAEAGSNLMIREIASAFARATADRSSLRSSQCAVLKVKSFLPRTG